MCVWMCVSVREREKELKIYSCHNLKCRLLMLFIFMSSLILKFDFFMKLLYQFISSLFRQSRNGPPVFKISLQTHSQLIECLLIA